MKARCIIGGMILITVIFSCEYPDKVESVPVMDIGKAMDAVGEIRLSDITDELSFVALETSDSSLTGNYPDIAVWGDRIIVSSTGQPLLVFDKKDGHFCNTIGHSGDDPEGYATDGSGNLPFGIDQTTGTVYLRALGDQALLRYDMEGHFLGKATLDRSRLSHISTFSSCFLHISNDTVTFHNKYLSSVDAPFLMSFNAINGDLLALIPCIGTPSPPPAEIMSANYMCGTYVPYGGMGMLHLDYADNQTLRFVPHSPSVWNCEGARYVKEAFIDTIYTIEGGDLKPRLALDLGKWHWPYDRRFEKENSKKRIYIDYLLESKDLIYVHLHTGFYENREDSQSYSGFYNKRTGTTRLMKGESIADDLYHFLPLVIRRVSSDGEFVGLIQVSDIMRWKEDNPTSPSHPAIESLLQADEQDNPVAVFIKKRL